MKAAVYSEYGPPEVLSLCDLPKPVPKDHEVLIKIYAATVSSADCRLRASKMPRGFGFLARLFFGIRRPRNSILGGELSGVIEAVGSQVSKFTIGDEVFAFTGARLGCYVEFKCLHEDDNLVRKPKNLSFSQAAALSFGGTTALHFLRLAKVHQGDSVLVVGASGCVGSAAVQIAKSLGAHVTGVCSGRNSNLVRSIGADTTIDYTQVDFLNGELKYDAIIDTMGTAPFSLSKNALKESGKLLLVLASLQQMLAAPFANTVNRKKVIVGSAPERAEDLHELARLAEEGKFTPVVDRTYRFPKIVEAHRYADTGRKVGNVIIDVNLKTDEA